LFNALLKQNLALAANYPFATIEPNVGVAQIPDERLAVLAKIVGTQTLKPATVEFVDIAGLVRGASKGEGLGNKFLAHIRETSAIVQVVRAFSDGEIIREGAVDPVADLAVVRMELQLADLATLEKQQAPKSGGSSEKQRWTVIEGFRHYLDQGKNGRDYIESLEQEEKRQEAEQVARELNLLTSKREIVVLNVDEGRLAMSETEWKKILPDERQEVIVVSAKVEAELGELDEAGQREYLASLGVKESGLERLARVAYKTLDLQSFLTAGSLEVRAWTIKRGTKAPQAAGVIHTDFEQKFNRAKVVDYVEFVRCDGWKGAAEAGKVRMEGKEYIMKASDIVEFL
jgi:GTP-binding protein YchF